MNFKETKKRKDLPGLTKEMQAQRAIDLQRIPLQ